MMKVVVIMKAVVSSGGYGSDGDGKIMIMSSHQIRQAKVQSPNPSLQHQMQFASSLGQCSW